MMIITIILIIILVISFIGAFGGFIKTWWADRKAQQEFDKRQERYKRML